MTTAQVHERLGEWLDGLEMPSLGDPQRRIEELRLDQLRNFLLLLLARAGSDSVATPGEALLKFGPELTELARYQDTLALPLSGTPNSIVTVLKLGQPSSELFRLQETLMDDLDDDGRRAIVELGKLF